MTQPLGIRQNNPGNIRPSAQLWQGQTGADNGFCVFDTPQNGLRAIGKILLSYQDHHDIRTIRGLIGRWAPSMENDTSAYVDAVAADCGIGPDVQTDVHDSSVLASLIAAIVQHENGQQPYQMPMIEAAAYAALAQWD